MARNWIEFDEGPATPGRQDLYATLNKRGEMIINRHTFEAMDRPEAVNVLLELETCTIGLRPASRLAPNAFPLKPKGNCDNHVIRIQPFCTRHEIKPAETIRFVAPLIEDGVLTLRLKNTAKATRKKRRKR